MYNGNLPTVPVDGKPFPCRSGHTVLVAVNRIIPQKHSLAKGQRTSHLSQADEKRFTKQGTSSKDPEVKLGDRVVWICPSNNQEYGIVRWIGVLPEAFSTSELTIGIECVSVFLSQVYIV